MKKLSLLYFLAISQFAFAGPDKPINPIIGDQSYILKYGHTPNQLTPDQERISAHLEYAEFVLRSKDVSRLSTEKVQKRTHLLDLLHEYWQRGVFPMNADVKYERRPCFIDHNGTICAVGYLVEQTAGRDMAELISERFMYDEILDMNDPIVINWMEQCGLTRKECAIIQPSYQTFIRPCNSLSLGISYRVNDAFYPTIRFTRQFKNFNDHRMTPSWGAQVDLLHGNAFSAGLLLSGAIGGRRFTRIGKGITIMPEYFQYDIYSGMNLRPGFQLGRGWKRFGFNVGYSYAIPVINESRYKAGRHDFSLCMSVRLSDNQKPRLPQKQKSKDPADQPQAWKE